MSVRSESWSTLQLAEFVAYVALSTDERDATARAVERAADALEAEVCALVSEESVTAVIGFPANRAPVRDLVTASRSRAERFALAELGEAWILTASLDADREGVLLVARVGGEGFSQEESDLLRGMARSLELTLRMVRTLDHERELRRHSQREVRQRKKAERELVHQGLHDPLTDLPNRRLLRDRTVHALERARGTTSFLAALLIDLDHFKLTNDSLGPRAGDELLSALALRLQDAIDLEDAGKRRYTLARITGDEFVVLGEELASEEDAINLADRLLAALRIPFAVSGQEVALTASIGVAVTSSIPAEAESLDDAADDLLRDADVAMSRAKERGRDCYEVFDQAMRVRLLERIELESDLRAALERDELRLVYQPVVSVVDAEMVAVEALLRWEHPRRGLLAPGEFIGVAEQSELIVTVGEWVIAEACRQLRDWAAEGCNVRMSVNVSARQLSPCLVDFVTGALARNGLEPGRLALELTESLLIEHADAAGTILDDLKALGVGIVLDDFGTGYSSLGYLKRFPLDQIKLDRSFISELAEDARSAKIVSAAIEMARALGMTVVAEGVETIEQLEILSRLRCDYAQGFHFARPSSADAIGVRISEAAQRHSAEALATKALSAQPASLMTAALAPVDEDAARRQAAIGRVAGYLFLAGGLLALPVQTTLSVGGSPILGAALAVLGIVSGLICLRAPWARLSPGWLHVTAIIATAEVSLAVWASGSHGSVYSWLYVLIATAAAYAFHDRRTLAAYVVVLAGAIGLPLLYGSASGVDTLPRTLVAISVVALMVTVVASLRERLEAGQAELRELAARDPLTGVGNYRLLHERLDYELNRHQRSRLKFALLVIDLDRFKQVNERLGHAAGDEVLKRVARVMSAAVRHRDTVVRQGGDEFAVLAPETDSAGAEILASRIRERLAEVQFEGETIGATVAYAVYPDEAASTQLLLACADSRLLTEKSHSRRLQVAPAAPDVSTERPERRVVSLA